MVRSYLERGIQWFGSAQSLNKHVEVDSKIDLHDKDAPPTIFMGFHYVATEVGCILYSTRSPAASLYTRMSNARLCDLTRRQRGRFGAEMIEHSTTARKIVGLLRSGKPVMLAADMDHVIDNSVFVPFFGVPACTLTSVSRLARPGHARVVPFVTQVLPNYREYKLTVFEPFEDFPSKKQVLNCPEQYYRVHRRFKHRPPGAAAVY